MRANVALKLTGCRGASGFLPAIISTRIMIAARRAPQLSLGVRHRPSIELIQPAAPTLSRLTESRLTEVGRAADLQLFTFRRRSTDATVLSLHVSCPWRLTGEGSVIAGGGDYWRPASSETDESHVESGAVGTRLGDVRNAELRRLLGADGLEVLTADIDAFGGITVELTGRVKLELFPDASPADHDPVEFWRLIEHDGPHTVAGTDGIDYVTDV